MMKLNHFLSIQEVTRDQIDRIFDVAFVLRKQRESGLANDPVLAGKTLALIFEKPSLRTRVSFEQAMLELGGHAIRLGWEEVGMGKREQPGDVARVLSGLVHGIMARVYGHQKLLDLACHSTIPVINALSDESHPCQALADAMTLMDQFGRDLAGRTLVYVGDGNNVAHSLAMICGTLEMNFILASPPGYELRQNLVDRIRSHLPNMKFEMTHDAFAAMRHADCIYTDTWVSMGQEQQTAQRRKDFADYQINEQLVAAAPDHAIVLHCLPAYRNVEITDEVMDGPQSRVFLQAHNRLHAQKGLLAVLIGGA